MKCFAGEMIWGYVDLSSEWFKNGPALGNCTVGSRGAAVA